MHRLQYNPSWKLRWARRGGSTVFYEGSPPVDATGPELLAWAQESQRRCGEIMLACHDARSKGEKGFYHPRTGRWSGDIELHLLTAQHRQMAAAAYMEVARNAG